MRTILPCPKCGGNPTDSAVKLWFIHGFLILASYGSKVSVGCRSCVTAEVWKNFVLCLLFGWWCFPWGLGTPFVLLQNLAALFRGGQAETELLGETLVAAGIDPQDVVVDQYGITGQQRKLINGIIASQHGAIWCDGKAPPEELDAAVAIARALCGAVLTSDQVRARLQQRDPPPLHPESFDFEERLVLLRAAGDVIASDGRLEPEEVSYLFKLGQELRFSHRIVEGVLRDIYGVDDESEPPEDVAEREAAARLLGVSPSASVAEIKKAHRRLALRYHPDMVAPSERERATQNMAALNHAYSVLLAGSEATRAGAVV